jgi:hypothetical protein
MCRKKNASNVNFNVTAESCITPHLHLCCRGILIYGKKIELDANVLYIWYILYILYTVHSKTISMVHIKHSEMRQLVT